MSNPTRKISKWSRAGLLTLSFVAFISLGLPDGLLGVAWPGIRLHFSLPIDALGIILIVGTAGYILSSFLSGILIQRLGIGILLGLSCGATAGALLVYAYAPFWWLFVVFAAVAGLGAGAIDAGINTFVARHYDQKVMQWLHASFGVGITLGPIIMTLGLNTTTRWQTGYIIVGIAQGVLAVGFMLTRALWKSADSIEHTECQSIHATPLLQTLGTPSAWLSMLMFFIYTGVELGLGLWAYTIMVESRGISHEIAGMITASYWAAFTLGRILAGLYAEKFRTSSLIYTSLFLALGGISLLLFNTNQVATIIGISLTGLAIAPVFPGLVSDTQNRVGHQHQANTIGMQIAAAGLGAAVVPSLAGIVARFYGLTAIPIYLSSALILLLLCFAGAHRIKPAIPA